MTTDPPRRHPIVDLDKHIKLTISTKVGRLNSDRMVRLKVRFARQMHKQTGS